VRFGSAFRITKNLPRENYPSFRVLHAWVGATSFGSSCNRSSLLSRNRIMGNDPSSLFLSDELVRELVPNSLPQSRDERYVGGAVHGRLDRDFGEEEQETLRSLYVSLGGLMELTAKRDASEDGNSMLSAKLRDFARECPILQAGRDLEKYGRAAQETYDSKLARLFRELTDGPLASLYGIIFLVGSSGAEPEYFQTLFYLSRDQRKIMRSLIVDLDPTARQRDEMEQFHSVSLLLEKWQKAVYRAFDEELEVAFRTNFEGAVAERCIEFAEVDRIFYHLVNNAIRHGSDKTLAVQVVESSNGDDLIWLFSNPVSENQAKVLQNFVDGRQSVFEYGIGSESGVGLGSLAESVAHAYGIEAQEQVISGSYAGSSFADGIFRIWFHWPKTTEA